jgi:hypothetical protein
MVEKGMPVYHLSKEFCEEVDATNPPFDLLMGELHNPFPTTAFCLPKDFSRTAFGTTLTFLLITKLKNQEIVKVDRPIRLEIKNDGDKTCFLSASEDTMEGLPIHYGFIGRNNHCLSNILGEEYVTDFSNPLEYSTQFKNIQMSKEEEKKVPIKTGLFGFKLLLILNLIQNFIPKAQEPKILKSKKEGVGYIEYHNFLWIGREYKTRSEGTNDSHTSPKMH